MNWIVESEFRLPKCSMLQKQDFFQTENKKVNFIYVSCQNTETKIIMGKLIIYWLKLTSAIKMIFSVDVSVSLSIYTEKLTLVNFTNICGVLSICWVFYHAILALFCQKDINTVCEWWTDIKSLDLSCPTGWAS